MKINTDEHNSEIKKKNYLTLYRKQEKDMIFGCCALQITMLTYVLKLTKFYMRSRLSQVKLL